MQDLQSIRELIEETIGRTASCGICDDMPYLLNAESVAGACMEILADWWDWRPISTAPLDREIELRWYYIPSKEAERNGSKAQWVSGKGRWLFGNTWSGILSTHPSHWKDCESAIV